MAEETRGEQTHLIPLTRKVTVKWTGEGGVAASGEIVAMQRNVFHTDTTYLVVGEGGLHWIGQSEIEITEANPAA